MEWTDGMDTPEWTDGMEYQLTKIAKTHYHGHGEVVSHCSLQLECYMSSICFLALYPGSRAECSACGQGYVWHG